MEAFLQEGELSMDVNQLKRKILQYELTVEKHKTVSKHLSTVMGVICGFGFWLLVFWLLMDVVKLDVNGWVLFISLLILMVLCKFLSKSLLLSMFAKKRIPLFDEYNKAKKEMNDAIQNYESYLMHETLRLKCYLNQTEEGIGESWWGKRELVLTCDESDLVYTYNIESIEEFVEFLTKLSEYGFQINEEIIEYICDETFKKGNPFVLNRVFKRNENNQYHETEEDSNDVTEQPSSEDSIRRKYLSLLQIEDGCTRADLKKAYREKTKEFHPDTIQGKGLNELFIHFAEEQFKLLTEAYEWLDKNTEW